MKVDLKSVVEECSQGSLTGAMTFPQVLQKLNDIGVERYHADYSRHEITYYLEDGTSHVVDVTHPDKKVALEFRADLVALSVQQSQRNEHTYNDFVCKTMDAGCVGYFVQLSGGQVIYFGRNGESHVERFPAFARLSGATTT